MNRFILHTDARLAAQMHCDKHVVKMILEEAQMLSTAHRLLDGVQFVDSSSGRRIKRWKLDDSRDSILYKATHVGHPCTQWSMMTNNNYIWSYCLLDSLLDEYTFRYGKHHKTEELMSVLKTPPNNIPFGPLTTFPQAMPDECKLPNSVDAYRKYYLEKKKSFAKWSNREVPEWWEE
jgi:hypothetical protein